MRKNSRSRRKETNWKLKYSDLFSLEWPAHLKRSVTVIDKCADSEDDAVGEQQSTVALADNFCPGSSLLHESAPAEAVRQKELPDEQFQLSSPHEISCLSGSTTEIAQVGLYDPERAREMYLSRYAGTLNRRITPCCSAFYENMVVLGLDPPFEGLYPCTYHNNYFTAWRKSIEQTRVKRENRLRQFQSHSGIASFREVADDPIPRLNWEPEYHVYRGES